MKEFCENELCENPGAKVVPVSVRGPSDQRRTFCLVCENAYATGVQHGMAVAQAQAPAPGLRAKPPKLSADHHGARSVCHQCSGPFRIDSGGVANHIRGDGSIDHDLDAHHVPYQIPEPNPLITRRHAGRLQILCCPAQDRTGQPGIAKPDVVGCGSSDLTREGEVIECSNCGIWIEGQEHGQWQDAITVHLTSRELATILAALRFHQEENLQGDSDIPDQFIRSIATDVGRFTPLSGEEIDVLCIRLNRGESARTSRNGGTTSYFGHEHDLLAQAQGWSLFNTGTYDYPRLQVQRIDQSDDNTEPKFSGDEAAAQFVLKQAQAGDDLATRAFAVLVDTGSEDVNAFGLNLDEPGACECDNTHQANNTVCRWCWHRGRRKWNDPEIKT